MNGPSELDLEHLLQDGAWLRRFVGTLVAPQDVDDVVQATWLAAVEEPGRARGPVAAWLRGVSANVARLLHRSRHRRSRAFGRMPQPDGAPPTADVVAGLEVQRAVSDALLALPEPTRTIVVLRYQQGLSPAAIAARVGLRVDAVRQRLHRGREAVRERLQQRFGADWRGSVAIAAFAVDGAIVAPGAAVPLVFAATAAAALAAVTFATWTPSDLRAPSAGTVAAGATRSLDPVADSSVPNAGLASERQLVAAAQDPLPAPATATAREVRGRLVAAEDGSPIADATIMGNSKTAPKVISDADGRFALRPEGTPRETIWIRAAERCERWYEPASSGSVDLGDIPLTRGYAVRGRVLDEHGASIAKVRVEARIDGEIAGPGGTMTFPAAANGDGSFLFRQPVPAGAITLQAGTPGIVFTDGDVTVVAQPHANEFVLHARRLRSISGVVFDSEGRPCAGVNVAAFPAAVTRVDEHGVFPDLAQARSQPDGSFELFEERNGDEVFVGASDTAAHDLVGDRIATAWGARGLRLTVRARIPVRLLVVEAETDAPIPCFAYSATWRRDGVARGTGDSPPRERSGGRFTFDGLPAGADVLVWGKDPTRAPVVVLVDESMRDADTVRVALPKLQAFPIVLVDASGNPVATTFDLIDRCGAPAPEYWSEPHAKKLFTSSFATTPSALRLSGGTTDKDGKSTLLAATDRRDLALCIQRDQRKLWVPFVLPAPGATLRLVVPD